MKFFFVAQHTTSFNHRLTNLEFEGSPRGVVILYLLLLSLFCGADVLPSASAKRPRVAFAYVVAVDKELGSDVLETLQNT